jgi:rhamnogalacturonyl hydrolase YesR
MNVTRRAVILVARRATPRATALALVPHYATELPEVVYIPAMALIAKLRLGMLEAVEPLVKPFVDGTRDSLGKLSPSHLSGHLLFAELAQRTGNAAYRERVRTAAALAKLPVYQQMSDGVFMGCPILAAAGEFDEAATQLEAQQAYLLRPNGLYRHTPLCEASWGRGNAFPALGMALALEWMPADAPAAKVFREAFGKLCATLVRYQTRNGMWRQVVDRPDSYEEYSCTAMIGAAFRKGIRNQWLPRQEYGKAVERAWAAIAARTSMSGEVLDVCESTGKLATVEEYLRRKAIRGRDPRGGGMGMYFATELMR